MLMKLLGVCCAIAATGTVLVYGFGLQVQRPIEPLQAKQEAPITTPKADVVVSEAPIHAPEEVVSEVQNVAPDVTPDVATAPIAVEPETQVVLDVSVVPEISAAASEITISQEPVIAEESPAPQAEQVFIFWQPFRSRGSAQGFAQGLSARAEVPISVISEDTDSGRYYRVVLPYDSEAQRLERLAKLESATRLEMGE